MGTESTARLDRLYDWTLKRLFGFDSGCQSLTAFTLSASRLLRVARDSVDFGNGYDRLNSTLCASESVCMVSPTWSNSVCDRACERRHHLENLLEDGLAYVCEQFTFDRTARNMTDILLWPIGRKLLSLLSASIKP